MVRLHLDTDGMLTLTAGLGEGQVRHMVVLVLGGGWGWLLIAQIALFLVIGAIRGARDR